MPRYIIKIKDDPLNKDYYLEWSTIVDAPVTWGLSLEEFKEYYQKQYGVSGMRDFDERIVKVELTGISADPSWESLENLFEYNRAGKGESCLDKEGILKCYCRDRVV